METQNNQLPMNTENDYTLERKGESTKQFMKNNYVMIVAIAAILLLTIVFIILFMHVKSSTPVNTTSSSKQTITPSESPAVTQAPTDSPQVAEIKSQINSQIKKVIAPNVSFEYTFVKTYGASWATANIYNPTVGGGLVIVKKVNGTWTVVLGPGSAFSSQQLSTISAPQALVNDLQSTQESPTP
jgi:hypothetical protein